MNKIIVLMLCSTCTVGVFSDEYKTRVVFTGLERPTGITVQGSSTLFITQLPTPGVPGSLGGRNTVSEIRLESGRIKTLTMGEPEPTNLALDKHGNLYWTCKSAGVILQRNRRGKVELFLGGLPSPSGIAVYRWDNVYFTLVPTPGVPGGDNCVHVTDGTTITELSSGEPEPSDIAVSPDGTAYWTCTTAGVILFKPDAGPVGLLLDGLESPVGIALNHEGDRLFWTEVPTPGVPGRAGGQNKVSELNLRTMEVTLVDAGDPEPTDISVGQNGNLFWTCTSAGVIVQAERTGGREDD